MVNNVAQKPNKFSINNFAPAWGAAVMGTAVIAVLFKALALQGVGFFSAAGGVDSAAQGTATTVFNALAYVFLVVAVIFAILILGATTIRWFKNFVGVQEDLKHPVKGAMSATFAGGFLVLAVAVDRVLVDALEKTTRDPITLVLAGIGAALALYIGLKFLTAMFAAKELPKGMITGAWFIPPVVTIIFPTAIAPMLDGSSSLHKELFWLAWIFLGIGSMLYIVIVATLFYRTVTLDLPPAPLAPSLIIGMGPAGLIGLNSVLMAEAAVRMNFAAEMFIEISSFIGVIMWGFGAWWAIATVIILRKAYEKVPFSLAWWGFTFPLGAWAVAGIKLSETTWSSVVYAVSIIGSTALVIIWTVVLIRTLKAVKSGVVWAQ